MDLAAPEEPPLATANNNFEQAPVLQEVQARRKGGIRVAARLAELQALLDQYVANDELEEAADVMEAIQSAASADWESHSACSTAELALEDDCKPHVEDMLKELQDEGDRLMASCTNEVQAEMAAIQEASSIAVVKKLLQQRKAEAAESAISQQHERPDGDVKAVKQCGKQIKDAEAAVHAAVATGDLFALMLAKDEVKTQRLIVAKVEAEARAQAEVIAQDNVKAAKVEPAETSDKQMEQEHSPGQLFQLAQVLAARRMAEDSAAASVHLPANTCAKTAAADANSDRVSAPSGFADKGRTKVGQTAVAMAALEVEKASVAALADQLEVQTAEIVLIRDGDVTAEVLSPTFETGLLREQERLNDDDENQEEVVDEPGADHQVGGELREEQGLDLDALNPQAALLVDQSLRGKLEEAPAESQASHSPRSPVSEQRQLDNWRPWGDAETPSIQDLVDGDASAVANADDEGEMQIILIRAAVDFTVSGKTSTTLKLSGCGLTVRPLDELWELIQFQAGINLQAASITVDHLTVSCTPPGPDTRRLLMQRDQSLSSRGYKPGSLIYASCTNNLSLTDTAKGLSQLQVQLNLKLLKQDQQGGKGLRPKANQWMHQSVIEAFD